MYFFFVDTVVRPRASAPSIIPTSISRNVSLIFSSSPKSRYTLVSLHPLYELAPYETLKTKIKTNPSAFNSNQVSFRRDDMFKWKRTLRVRPRATLARMYLLLSGVLLDHVPVITFLYECARYRTTWNTLPSGIHFWIMEACRLDFPNVPPPPPPPLFIQLPCNFRRVPRSKRAPFCVRMFLYVFFFFLFFLEKNERSESLDLMQFLFSSRK